MALLGQTYNSKNNRLDKALPLWGLHSIEGSQTINMLMDTFKACQIEDNKYHGRKSAKVWRL